GHSAFNNRTRHRDARNALYLRMVRAAAVLAPKHLVIENVPGARRDREAVVDVAVEALERLGYASSIGVVDAATIGVAQRRKRLVLLASRTRQPAIEVLLDAHGRKPRSLRWAIEDLLELERRGILDEPTASAPQTRARIAYLFEHDLFDLPNSERP